jgi:KaiC/GvpD/RAD55 family RecA-like ATPase
MELDFTNDMLERIIIKKSLLDKRFMTTISPIMDMRWFESSKSLGIIGKLIVKYFNAYDNLPSTKIVDAMISKYCEHHQDLQQSEILRELNEVSRLDIDLSLDVVQSNLQRFIKEKLLYYTIHDNAVDIMEHGSVDKCIDKFEKIQKLTFEETNLGMSYFKKEDQEKHWDYINNPVARISSGFDGLDRYTHGGFYRSGKMLGCIMGQAGLGKSLFLSNIAVNCLKQDMNVVVISLEMSEDVYATRFDAHISDSNINRLKENGSTVIERINNFYKQHPNANLFIKEYPPRSVKVSDIVIYLDNLVAAGNKIDIIIIDYLNLVLPNKSRDNMYQDIQNVAEKLRALSYIYEVPVITATQATTEGMNNENIGMEHVSESRGIAHTVDLLVGLYQMDEDRNNGIINMRIIKNRLGGCVGKVIPFRVNSESLVLKDETFSPEGLIGVSSETEEIISSNFEELSQDIDGV